MGSPHDALFKQAFSLPNEAAAEFRHVLPDDVGRDIDWSSLRLQPASFVDDELRDRHADLLFSADYRGSKALLYCLLEHKSSPDRWTPLQVQRYTMRIWERWLRESGSTDLPAVFTVVVHHGSAPWSGPRSLIDLIDVPDGVRDRIAPYQPSCPFVIDDLVGETAESLQRRTPSVLAPLVLFCLQRSRECSNLLAELVQWRAFLRRASRASHGVESLTAIMSYIIEVQHVPMTQVRQFLRVHVDPAMESPVFTMIDFLKEKFREEGREEGREAGREEGREEGREAGREEGRREGFSAGRNKGQAELLLRLLHARFGDAVAGHVDRVRTATAADLAIWAERVLSAETLDEVFEARG